MRPYALHNNYCFCRDQFRAILWAILNGSLYSTGVVVVAFLVGAILGAASIIIYNNKRYVNSHCVSRLPLSRDAYLVFRLILHIYAAVWQPDMHVAKYTVELPSFVDGSRDQKMQQVRLSSNTLFADVTTFYFHTITDT